MQLTYEKLREVLVYCPETGVFRWRMKVSIGTRIGGIAGAPRPDGYVRLQVFGRKYMASRLAWLYMTGNWPEHGVDHKDGNRSNNRWGNLRDVPQSVNMQNQRRARSDNSTGLLGAHRHSSGKGFTSTIIVNGRRHHLGSFPTAQDAHAAYLLAKRRMHLACTI